MINRVLLSGAVALALCLPAAAQTAPPTKVGIINIQAAMVGTREGQKAQADLQARSAPKQKELEKKRADIEALREQMNRTSNTASEEARRKLAADIDIKTKSFNRDVEDAQAELDQDQNRILNDLGGKMMQVIDRYARDNGFAMIIDVSSQQTPVVYASSTIDVTKDIIDLYDKNTAAGAAAAPAAPAPTSGAKPAIPAPKPPAGGAAKPAAPKPGATK